MRHPTSYDSTPETRKRMANVKLKNGRAESLLAKKLWHLGYRYRKNDKRYPGSPDIAITKYKVAVFVDGEFWHGKDWEQRRLRLQRNREYWIEKIEENISRDKRNDAILIERGWIPIHFWERDVLRNTDQCASLVVQTIEAGVMLPPQKSTITLSSNDYS